MVHLKLFVFLALTGWTGGADEGPLSPEAARKKVGETITVEMTVQASKDASKKRGEIYLDAELDFRDEKNFAVVITKDGAADLRAAGIDEPATHFKDKKIRATGTVKEVDKIPRIEIDEAKQIEIYGNEFMCLIKKVDDAKITLNKSEGQEKKDDETLAATDACMVCKGKWNKGTEKLEGLEVIADGLKWDVLAKLNKEGVRALVVTNADNRIIEIRVRGPNDAQATKKQR